MPPKPNKMPKNGSNPIDDLKVIARYLGYDPDNLSVNEKTDMAARLSTMANRSNPWGWRYIHNLICEKVTPSNELSDAIHRLGLAIDGTPDVLARSKPVQCLAIGNVTNGSLIMADSRRCKNPACGMWFIPTTVNMLYHCLDCKRAYEKIHKRQLRRQLRRQERN